MLHRGIFRLLWIFFLVSTTQDTAGKYRELAAKKCHHVPKPSVELHRLCIQAECPIQTTPAAHRWSMHHLTRPPQPPPQAGWQSSPWSQVRWPRSRITLLNHVTSATIHFYVRWVTACVESSDWIAAISHRGFASSVLRSAQWHVEEGCRSGQPNVWSKGSPLLPVASILNPQCRRPATQTSASNRRRKVQKRQEIIVLPSRLYRDARNL